MQTNEFKVPVENLAGLVSVIAALNKKAAKLGTADNTLVFGELVSEQVGRNNGQKVMRQYQMVSVVGETPVLPGGWQFVGKIEPHAAGSIVKSIPGFTLPEQYQHGDAEQCDHCNIRRQRNATFVVKSGDNLKQVGRSCLKDFLGHKSPEQYAAYAEFVMGLEDTLRGYSNGALCMFVPRYDTIETLAVAVASIKKFGFQDSSSETPTKVTMDMFLNPSRDYVAPFALTEQDKIDAEATVAYVIDVANTDKSEFFQNLNKFVSVEENTSKTFGYLAAAVMMYLKKAGQMAARKSVKDGVVDAAIGAVGEKVKLTATVISATRYQRQTYHWNDSGISQVLMMKTAAGNLIKMFTINLEIEKDDVVTISGKLGENQIETFEHSPFKGLTVTTMAPRSRIAVV